ncbi:RHS repeat-associated core domain-containing protein [Pseudomonas wadenswilerensis]
MSVSPLTRSILAVDGRNTPVQPFTVHGYRAPSRALVRTGFNGEFQERSGVYVLGSHRAYNPVLMRFHNPDRLSPFGRGGLNAYGYCLGDPVNWNDPTGRIPWWAGALAGVATTLLVAPLAALALPASGLLATPVAASAKVVAGIAGTVSLGTGGGAAFSGPGQLRETLELVSFASGIVSGGAAGVAARGAAARLLPKSPRRASNASHSSRARTGSLEMPGDHVRLSISGSDPVERSLAYAVNEAYAETEALRLRVAGAQTHLERMTLRNQLQHSLNVEHFAREGWANHLKRLPPSFNSVTYRTLSDPPPSFDQVVSAVSDIRAG